MIVYHLTTGNYLHRCKKFFSSKRKLVEFLDNILQMAPKKLHKDFIDSSYRVIGINVDLVPEYESLYLQSDIQEPYNFMEQQQVTWEKIMKQHGYEKKG